jgi:hypothetical protein
MDVLTEVLDVLSEVIYYIKSKFDLGIAKMDVLSGLTYYPKTY